MIFQICVSQLWEFCYIRFNIFTYLNYSDTLCLLLKKNCFHCYLYLIIVTKKSLSILFQKFLIACHKLLAKTVLLSWFKCNPLSPKCFLLMLLLSIVWVCNSLINLFFFWMVGFAFVLSVCTINLHMITQDFGSGPSIFFLMWSIYLWSFVEYQLLHCWYQHGS